MMHMCLQMYLTLPLPMDKTRTAEVNIVHVDGSKAPALHAVDVPKAGSVGDIYAAIAQVWSCLCNALTKLPGDELSCRHLLTLTR